MENVAAMKINDFIHFIIMRTRACNQNRPARKTHATIKNSSLQQTRPRRYMLREEISLDSESREGKWNWRFICGAKGVHPRRNAVSLSTNIHGVSNIKSRGGAFAANIKERWWRRASGAWVHISAGNFGGLIKWAARERDYARAGEKSLLPVSTVIINVLAWHFPSNDDSYPPTSLIQKTLLVLRLSPLCYWNIAAGIQVLFSSVAIDVKRHEKVESWVNPFNPIDLLKDNLWQADSNMQRWQFFIGKTSQKNILYIVSFHDMETDNL